MTRKVAGRCCFCAVACLLIAAASPRTAHADYVSDRPVAAVEMWAGQDVDAVRLEYLPDTNHADALSPEDIVDGGAELPNLQPTPVPEPPSVIAALVLGSAALMRRRRRPAS